MSCLQVALVVCVCIFSILLIIIMAGQVKLFQMLQNIYFNLGIFYPSQSNQNHSINSRKLFFLISYVQMLVLSFEFLLFEAKSIPELGISFYSTVTELGCLINFLMIKWKIPEIFDLIGKFEKFIEKSVFHQSSSLKDF